MSDVLILTIAVFLGAVVSGFAGFAFSAVAGAVLLHVFEPLLAIPLMMSCSVISQFATLVALRRFIRWRELTWLLIGGAAGIPIALYVLMRMDPGLFRTAFGVFLASYSAYLLFKPGSALLQKLRGRTTQCAVGFAGGLVGGLTAMPGALPAIWCELRGSTKEQQRGLVQPFIFAMQVFALGLLLLQPAGFHQGLSQNLLIAMPALAAGTFVGMLLFGKLNDKAFRACVLALLLISGCGMIDWQVVLPLASYATPIAASITP
jgi:uncharacterized protein